MGMTGLSVFDTTVQKTNLWLKDLMWVLGWEDKQKADLPIGTVCEGSLTSREGSCPGQNRN